MSASSAKPFISRDCTTCLYGVAILLMVFHHTLGFPGVFSVPYTFPELFNHDLLQIVAWRVGKQCVAIYAFMGGFGLALLARKLVWNAGLPTIESQLKLVWSRLVKFYPRYWFVMAIMIPLGVVVGAQHLDGGVGELFMNAVGLDDSYCETWWYVKQYVFMLLVFPLFDFAFNTLGIHARASVLRVSLLAIPAFTCGCLWSVWVGIEAAYTCVFILGMLIARSDLFERFRDVSTVPQYKVVALAALFAVFGARIALSSLLPLGIWADLVLIVPLIWSLTVLLAEMRGYVSRTFRLFGVHSTTIWLTHSLVVVYYFPNLALLPQHAALVFAWCVVISLVVGIVVDYAYDALRAGLDRIKALFARSGQTKHKPSV